MNRSHDDSPTPHDPTKAAHASQQTADVIGDPSMKHLTLGERLRIARYAAHLTQEELAGETFSKSYISAVERSKMTPSISALRLLAERLTVSLAYLLGEQDIDLNAEPGSGSLEGSGAQAELSPEEVLLARQLNEVENLLLSNAPNAALERLGNPAAAAELSQAQQARWHWLYGWALLQLHREQEAQVALKQGLEAARASHNLRSEAHLHFTLAKASVALGQENDADQSFQEAIHSCEQLGDYHLLACVHEEYGAFLAAQEHFQEAYEQMQRAQAASARLRGNR